MSKMYLLSASLLLLNPCFSEEERQIQLKPVAQSTIDPKVLEEMNAEISSILEEQKQGVSELEATQENAIVEKESMVRIRRYVTSPSQSRKQVAKAKKTQQAAVAVAPALQQNQIAEVEIVAPALTENQVAEVEISQQTAEAVAPVLQENQVAEVEISQQTAEIVTPALPENQVAEVEISQQTAEIVTPALPENLEITQQTTEAVAPTLLEIAENSMQNPPQEQNYPQNMPPADQKSQMPMEYNTSARPIVKDGLNLFVEGEALLWQAYEDNLTYIYSGNDTAGRTSRDEHSVHYSWDFGFRVGLGYNIPRDGWDISLYWTNIRNTAHGNQTASPTKTLYPVWTDTANPYTGIISSAHGRWKVNLDQVDLDLGKEFYVGRRVKMRPFAGIRSDWIYQKYDVAMNGALAGVPLQQTALLRNRYFGTGVVAGLGASWMLGCGLSIYGDADLALLVGFFHIDERGTQNGSTIWNVDKSFRTQKTAFDLSLGLKWSRLFCDDSFALTLKAGYEFHIFFNQNQFLLTNGSTTSQLFNPVQGDLSYQGAVGSVQFDF